MKNQVLIKKLEELFEELRSINLTIPIIVEGKNDEAALRELRVNGKIIRLNTGSSILNFCEEIAKIHNEIILLPDWDVKGQQLLKKLKKDFKPSKVKIIDRFWLDFKKYCSKEIHQVEYLTKYLEIITK
jgi:5S rRNA maturation endonuclease (ribonuclease M5)